jgi:penicillin-binding protein 1A
MQNFLWRKKRYIFDGIILVIIFCFLGSIAYAFFTLPRTTNLENLQFMRATQVFDRNGQLISKLFEENRIVVPISGMSHYVQQGIVDNEDTRFYSHAGVDPIGIVRALWVDLRMGTFAEGGSTLTQQLAKNMFLTQEKTFTRKMKEILLALIIERKFSKQEILQAYLNQVYFGEGAYGVESASQVYFGKHASELTLGESALIAGLPRGPSAYSPYADPQAALARRAEVLNGMVKMNDITIAQEAAANKEPFVLIGKKKRTVQASYFLDYVANELVGRYGANRVYKGGLKVYTTLDSKTQQAAEATLGKYQGAVLALDPHNGSIRAMVGGRDYQESQINRVQTEIRQPGSSFKPFLYTVALNQGLTANAVIIDEKINIGGYSPLNSDKKYHGPVTLSKALRDSINVPAVKLAQQVGMTNVLSLAQAMGITTLVPQDNNLAAAIGGLTQGVNLLELTTAYTAFAGAGVLSKPVAIVKVLDENDQVLEEDTFKQQQVISPEIAYIMTTMMMGTINSGTGTAANIGRPAAGKTGTTDNYETAWFIGYTPDLLTGIYVGNDDRTPVQISGSQVAILWGTLMTKAEQGIPVTNFPVPANIIANIPISSTTGRLALFGGSEVERSAFIKGTEPAFANWMLGSEDSGAAPTPDGDSAYPQAAPPTKKKSKWQDLLPRLPGF